MTTYIAKDYKASVVHIRRNYTLQGYGKGYIVTLCSRWLKSENVVTLNDGEVEAGVEAGTLRRCQQCRKASGK